MNDSEYDKKLKRFLIPILRRKSLYWPGRQEAKRDARVERGFYKCFHCDQFFSTKEVHVDHRDSVISTKEGWVDWDTYIKRLFVPKEQLQILCVNCHNSKSLLEQEIRKVNKKKNAKRNKIKK